MTTASTQQAAEINIGEQTHCGHENIQWIRIDYHCVPTDIGADQPQLVGVSVMNEHDGRSPTRLVDGDDEPSYGIDNASFLDLCRHCEELELIEADRAVLPSG